MAEPSIAAQVAALQKMSVAQLRLRWLEIFHEPTRQRHRRFLIKRLSAAIQNDTGPKLTPEEESKVQAYQEQVRQLPPERWFPGRQRQSKAKPKKRPPRRQLKPGSVITRDYHDETIMVKVLDDGLEFDGKVYRSLSAIAKEVTGTCWNGWRFFFGSSQGGQ